CGGGGGGGGAGRGGGGAGRWRRPTPRPGAAGAALPWPGPRGPAVAAVVEKLVTRPADAVAAFLRFLDRSWQEWFSAEWVRILPVLAARARLFADTVSVRGAATALAGLDSSVTVAASGDAVSIGEVRNARHDVSRRGLLVAPSTFIRPHLYVAAVPGRPLLLRHPADAGAPRPPAPG